MEDDDFECVDVRLLINEVKRHPEIWDIRNDAYKDRGRRQLAWEEIFANLFQDSNQKTEEEKNVITKKLSLKWKNMRDTFAKSIRKGYKSAQTLRSRPKRRYIYARQLSFLHESKALPSTGHVAPSSSPEANRAIPRHQNEFKSSLLNFMNSPIVVDPLDAEDDESDHVDIRLLINEVKQYREIWDIRSEAYKDRGKRQLAWEKIYSTLFQDLKTENEKNVIIKKLSLKWKNMRDTYAKSIRKGIVSSQTPRSRARRQYIYARQLSFLHDTMALADSVSSSSYTASKSSEVNRTASRRRHELTSSLMNFMKSPTVLEPPDADRSFFDSLMPTVKQFTEDQKLEFWGGVIQIVQNIKRKSLVPQEAQSDPTQTFFIPTESISGITTEVEIIPEIKPNLSLMHSL